MVEVAVAGMALIGSVLVAMIEKTRRQNTKEHNATYERLVRMEGSITARMDSADSSINRLTDKIDEHIDWHLDKATSNQTY